MGSARFCDDLSFANIPSRKNPEKFRFVRISVQVRSGLGKDAWLFDLFLALGLADTFCQPLELLRKERSKVYGVEIFKSK